MKSFIQLIVLISLLSFNNLSFSMEKIKSPKISAGRHNFNYLILPNDVPIDIRLHEIEKIEKLEIDGLHAWWGYHLIEKIPFNYSKNKNFIFWPKQEKDIRLVIYADHKGGLASYTFVLNPKTNYKLIHKKNSKFQILNLNRLTME